MMSHSKTCSKRLFYHKRREGEEGWSVFFFGGVGGMGAVKSLMDLKSFSA